jgi:hypothetical protein
MIYAASHEKRKRNICFNVSIAIYYPLITYLIWDGCQSLASTYVALCNNSLLYWQQHKKHAKECRTWKLIREHFLEIGNWRLRLRHRTPAFVWLHNAENTNETFPPFFVLFGSRFKAFHNFKSLLMDISSWLTELFINHLTAPRTHKVFRAILFLHYSCLPCSKKKH